MTVLCDRPCSVAETPAGRQTPLYYPESIDTDLTSQTFESLFLSATRRTLDTCISEARVRMPEAVRSIPLGDSLRQLAHIATKAGAAFPLGRLWQPSRTLRPDEFVERDTYAPIASLSTNCQSHSVKFRDELLRYAAWQQVFWSDVHGREAKASSGQVHDFLVLGFVNKVQVWRVLQDREESALGSTREERKTSADFWTSPHVRFSRALEFPVSRSVVSVQLLPDVPFVASREPSHPPSYQREVDGDSSRLGVAADRQWFTAIRRLAIVCEGTDSKLDVYETTGSRAHLQRLQQMSPINRLEARLSRGVGSSGWRTSLVVESATQIRVYDAASYELRFVIQDAWRTTYPPWWRWLVEQPPACSFDSEETAALPGFNELNDGEDDEYKSFDDLRDPETSMSERPSGAINVGSFTGGSKLAQRSFCPFAVGSRWLIYQRGQNLTDGLCERESASPREVAVPLGESAYRGLKKVMDVVREVPSSKATGFGQGIRSGLFLLMGEICRHTNASVGSVLGRSAHSEQSVEEAGASSPSRTSGGPVVIVDLLTGEKVGHLVLSPSRPCCFGKAAAADLPLVGSLTEVEDGPWCLSHLEGRSKVSLQKLSQEVAGTHLAPLTLIALDTSETTIFTCGLTGQGVAVFRIAEKPSRVETVSPCDGGQVEAFIQPTRRSEVIAMQTARLSRGRTWGIIQDIASSSNLSGESAVLVTSARGTVHCFALPAGFHAIKTTFDLGSANPSLLVQFPDSLRLATAEESDPGDVLMRSGLHSTFRPSRKESATDSCSSTAIGTDSSSESLSESPSLLAHESPVGDAQLTHSPQCLVLSRDGGPGVLPTFLWKENALSNKSLPDSAPSHYGEVQSRHSKKKKTAQTLSIVLQGGVGRRREYRLLSRTYGEAIFSLKPCQRLRLREPLARARRLTKDESSSRQSHSKAIFLARGSCHSTATPMATLNSGAQFSGTKGTRSFLAFVSRAPPFSPSDDLISSPRKDGTFEWNGKSALSFVIVSGDGVIDLCVASLASVIDEEKAPSCGGAREGAFPAVSTEGPRRIRDVMSIHSLSVRELASQERCDLEDEVTADLSTPTEPPAADLHVIPPNNARHCEPWTSLLTGGCRPSWKVCYLQPPPGYTPPTVNHLIRSGLKIRLEAAERWLKPASYLNAVFRVEAAAPGGGSVAVPFTNHEFGEGGEGKLSMNLPDMIRVNMHEGGQFLHLGERPPLTRLGRDRSRSDNLGGGRSTKWLNERAAMSSAFGLEQDEWSGMPGSRPVTRRGGRDATSGARPRASTSFNQMSISCEEYVSYRFD